MDASACDRGRVETPSSSADHSRMQTIRASHGAIASRVLIGRSRFYFLERLDDWVDEDSTVRVIDVFVEELDLQVLGFERCWSPRTLAVRRTTRRRC